MLINVGGGSPQTGQVAGIHWHMNIANEVTYIATDEHRQQIPWVRIKDMNGNVTEYYDRTKPLSGNDVATMDKRKMDCMDCHNRPAHTYQPPDVAMDQAFSAGKADPTLPFLKREAITLLSGNYDTNDEAVAAIDSGLTDFYRTNYPDVFAQKQDAIKSSIASVQNVYQTYFFPEMKTNWQTHPNNIGHMNFPGCFRCHDGNHVSNSGKVITNDCNVCHTVIYDSQQPGEHNAKTGAFQHPVDLGGLETKSCNTCHKADKPFQHPVNLGDISKFQCVVCHPRS
jgi:hypothetical protein